MKRLAAILLVVAFAAAVPAWYQVECPYQISIVAVGSDSEAWAAGTVGSRLSGFVHWDGTDWTLADTFRNQLVYDICLAGSEAWAVGEQFNFPDGVVFRWDGEHWQQQVDPFDRTLQAVAFPDSEHGFAAGAAPATQHPVMKYEDGVWRLDSALSTRRIILGLAFPWYGKGYAVGDSGAVFRYSEGTWMQLRSLTTQILRRVAMESNTEGWAVGNRGTILRCFKDTWALAPSPTTRNLYGLAIAGTSCEAWAVGDSGTILHCVRDSWHLEPFVPDPPDVPLYTVSFNSGSHGWAFGYRTFGARAALHYHDPLAVAERRTALTRPPPPATVARGVLVLDAADGREHPAFRAELLDATGRMVMRLASGPNDIQHLVPGVYFLRADGSESQGPGDSDRGLTGCASSVRRVVLAR